jgi:allantoicase
MSANKRHFFSGKAAAGVGSVFARASQHVPDGGISRLRIHGTLARDLTRPTTVARAMLTRACGSSRWVDRMMARRRSA